MAIAPWGRITEALGQAAGKGMWTGGVGLAKAWLGMGAYLAKPQAIGMAAGAVLGGGYGLYSGDGMISGAMSGAFWGGMAHGGLRAGNFVRKNWNLPAGEFGSKLAAASPLNPLRGLWNMSSRVFSGKAIAPRSALRRTNIGAFSARG
jgi:hypothetical protein